MFRLIGIVTCLAALGLPMAAHTLWQLNLSLEPASANLSGVQSTALNVVMLKQ